MKRSYRLGSYAPCVSAILSLMEEPQVDLQDIGVEEA